MSGDLFAMIDPAAMVAFSLPSWLRGADVSAVLRDRTGLVVARASRAVTGETLRGPAPAHLKAAIMPDGSASIAWTRRSRLGWAWVDDVDAPLGETSVCYRVRLSSDAGDANFNVDTPHIHLSPGEVAAMGPGVVAVIVQQLGDLAASHAATCHLPDRRMG